MSLPCWQWVRPTIFSGGKSPVASAFNVEGVPKPVRNEAQFYRIGNDGRTEVGFLHWYSIRMPSCYMMVMCVSIARMVRTPTLPGGEIERK